METAELVKLIIDEVEKTRPELFAKLYPRLYDNPGHWHSPRTAAGYMAMGLVTMRSLDWDDMPTAYRLMLPVMWSMIRKRMPWLFLAPDFVQAVKRTDFPHEIDWTELKLPYEQGGMILPRGALVHPKDGECSALFWSRLEPGRLVPPPGIPFPVFEFANKAFSIIGLCPQTGMWYDSNLTDHKRPVVKLNNLFYAEDGRLPSYHLDGSLTRALTDHDLDENVDRQFIEQMGVLIFGTMLALQARPELLEHGKLERTVKAKRGASQCREFWSPNVIGRSYRLPVHREAGGTHSSPRLHWRRGHFREQAYGPGRSERKTIWLEPQLIGADR